METQVLENKKKALLYILACVCLWALIPVVSKTGQRGLDNHQFLFWSNIISMLTLLVAAALNRKLTAYRSYSRNDIVVAAFTGFIGSYLCYILLYFGYASASGLEVLILQYSWPVMMVIISVFYLKEKQNARRLLSVVLGLAGVFIVLTKGSFHNINLGNLKVDLLVLAGAFCIALFSILSKKLTTDPYSLNLFYFAVGCACSLISMLIFSKFAWPPPGTIIPVLLNGILVNGISYILWVKGLRLANASYLAPFGFLTPVISSVYLVLFFNEPMLLPYVLGLALVLVSGFMNK
jgi:drug/metabolite transporter (DMT)-like permease